MHMHFVLEQDNLNMCIGWEKVGSINYFVHLNLFVRDMPTFLSVD